MKGPEAFRTISEAAEELGVPQHVLRFWETKFSFIRPMKRAGGRRFYRPQDIAVLSGVRALLHVEGYTIKGVQRLHKEQGMKRVLAAAPGAASAPEPAHTPSEVQSNNTPSAAHADAAVRGWAGDLTHDQQARLREALNGLVAAKARLERLIGEA
jgi:DNA-binding transcriptional MerR regulator